MNHIASPLGPSKRTEWA